MAFWRFDSERASTEASESVIIHMTQVSMSPIPVEFLQEFRQVIADAQKIVVIAHFRPDGDAIGSTIAMSEALRAQGKQVLSCNEDVVPEKLIFLPGTETIVPTPSEPVDADVLIVLDNGTWRRIGDRGMQALSKIPVRINIDHHQTNEGYGQLNCVCAEQCATSAVLYYLFRDLGWDITPTMRDCLYAGISTDTGSFQYDKTTPAVMEMAGHLLSLGVNVHEINRQLYQEIPWASIQLSRETLNSMQLEADCKIAYVVLSLARKNELGVTEDDTDGLIDIPRSIKGVVSAIVFEEMADGRIRISLRSKDARLSVSAIATQFGGGGHAMAAGVRMRCTLQEAQNRILTAVKQAISEQGI